jgi:hypothetical protein
MNTLQGLHGSGRGAPLPIRCISQHHPFFVVGSKMGKCHLSFLDSFAACLSATRGVSKGDAQKILATIADCLPEVELHQSEAWRKLLLRADLREMLIGTRSL